MSIVLTCGTFDLLHLGHMRFFTKCRAYGSVKIGLNTDGFIEQYKGKPPILSFEERLNTLLELGFEVEDIMPNDQPDGSIKDLIEHFHPDRIVIGSDWLKKPYLPQIGLQPEYLEIHDIDLIYVPYETSISSTEIKRRINERLSSS